MSTQKLSVHNLLSLRNWWTAAGCGFNVEKQPDLAQMSGIVELMRLPTHLRAAAIVESAKVASRQELAVLGPILADCAVASSRRSWIDKARWLLGVSGPGASGRACAAIVRRWNEYEDSDRALVLAEYRGSWPHVFAALAGDVSPSTRIGVASCLFALDRDDLLGCAIDLLPDPAAGAVAERVLMRAARRAAESNMPEGLVHGEILRAACGFATHQRRGVMGALLILISRENRDNRVWCWVRAGGPEVTALQGALRSTGGVAMRAKAWELLASPEFTHAAMDRLGRAKETAEHEVVLGSWALAAHPRRARSVRAAGLAAKKNENAWGGLPSLAQFARLSGPAQCGAMKLSTMCDAPNALIDGYVGAVLSIADPRVRHSASCTVPASLLVDLAFDAHACVAGTAATRLAQNDIGVDQSIWIPLARSPHAVVRSIASAMVWDAERAWLGASEPRLRVALRRGLARNRTRTLDGARAIWRHLDATRRAAMASTVRALGLGGELADILVPLVHAGAQEVGDILVLRAASAAVTALADAGAETAGAALRQCLLAHDGRLRSNALEALVRIRRDEPMAIARGTVIELKDDPHHRVRASAIRAMALLDDGVAPLTAAMAGEAASRMLDDHRTMHRLAGVWVAERLYGAGGLLRGSKEAAKSAATLRRRSTHEIEPRIVVRAAACLAMIEPEREPATNVRAMEAA